MEAFGTDLEIFEFAISREVEANQLYMAFAKMIENPELRKVFESFAEDELGHKSKLELEIIKQGRVVKNYEIEYTEMANVEIDQDIEYKDILMMAINKEREAFRIYIDLASVVRDPVSREMLLTLAEEEAKHKASFEIEYDKLTS